MESETTKEREMSPEIKEEKFDFYDWEECNQRYNTLGYYPIAYTTPSTYSSSQTALRYSFEEQETQAKPRMSFSISSILGTHEDSEEQRFHPIAHPPRYGSVRESLLMRHKPSAFRDSHKSSRMKRHFLQEEITKEDEEKDFEKGSSKYTILIIIITGNVVSFASITSAWKCYNYELNTNACR